MLAQELGRLTCLFMRLNEGLYMLVNRVLHCIMCIFTFFVINLKHYTLNYEVLWLRFSSVFFSSLRYGLYEMNLETNWELTGLLYCCSGRVMELLNPVPFLCECASDSIPRRRGSRISFREL